MSFVLVVLLCVIIAIACRQIIRLPLKIWQIMSLGALALLLTLQISPKEAYFSIDWNIIFFLWGMFVVAEAMEQSGFINQLLLRWFSGRATRKKVVFVVVFGMGLLSALFMNDTLAIIGVPLVLSMASMLRISPKFLLLGLAYSITLGSVMSPIGNPQNLLIALNAPIESAFVTFLFYLGPPTILSLFLLYVGLNYFLQSQEEVRSHTKNKLVVGDKKFAKLCSYALIFIVIMVGYNIIASLFGFKSSLPLVLIALIPAIFLLLFSSERSAVLLKIDWATLVFFISLFIVMESVGQTSLFNDMFAKAGERLSSLGSLMGISFLLSQLISNVPLVALILPILKQFGATKLQFMALSVGSTLAGNLLLLGAASNVIILQNAESRGAEAVSFFQFFKYGLPLTLVSFVIYWGYLSLLS